MQYLKDQFDFAHEDQLDLLKQTLTTANVNDIGEDGATVLFLAAQEGHTNCVQYILEMGADVNQEMETTCRALASGVDSGVVPVARLILEAGADVNHKDMHGRRPIDGAINLEMVHLLLDYGASFTMPNMTGFCSDRQLMSMVREREAVRHRALLVCAMRMQGIDRNIMRLVGKQIWSARFSP